MFIRNKHPFKKTTFCLSALCVILIINPVINLNIFSFQLIVKASAAEARRPFRPRHEVRPAEPRKAETLKKNESIKPKIESPLSKAYKFVPERKPRYATEASKKYTTMSDALQRKMNRTLTRDGIIDRSTSTDARKRSIDLSREYYRARARVSRDFRRDSGYPRNDGFVMKSVRSSSVKKGDVILRFDHPFGSYATRDLNASASSVGLYPKAEKFQKTYYRVLKDFPAIEGVAAKALGGVGGGNQLKFARNIDFLIKKGYLEKTNKP